VETLTARYPDGRTHLITAATIAIQRRAPADAPHALAGVIVGLSPSRITVPGTLARALPNRRFDQPPSAFSVSIRYGRLHEPWVVAVGR
jgi:hypothetical protein